MEVLQNRFQLEDNKIIYYGLRNKKHLFHNVFKLNKKQLEIVK